METSLLNQWFSGPQVNAICWTLIHSLWIGLVIALLCGIVIGTTRKSAAALRYRLLCGLLILFVCAIGFTYYLEASSAPSSSTFGHQANIQMKAPISFAVASPSVVQRQTFLESVQAFLNQNVNIIFLVWLLFFVLKSLKMVSGLLYIQRIRHYKTSEVTEELKHRIEQFSDQIGIRRVVRLVQSELVKVPVAVGWLKPMILLPVGIAFQLTPEQLDGILWHELAHIRRRDYLVNILQGLVETVFFFNPGLLWLSSLIRTEREACCDDMVLSRMNRKANYLEALLSFGYGEFSQARYAMSIGSGNQLRDRLKRMISQENKRLSVAEKSVLAVGLVLLSAFTTISKDNTVIKRLTVNFKNKSGKVVSKTFPVSMHRLPDGQRVNDSKPADRLKDTIVLRDTAIRFTSVLFKHSDADLANNDISAKDEKGNIYHFIVADGKIASMELNGVKVDENKLPNYEYTLQLIVSELMEKRRVRGADDAGFKGMNPDARLRFEAIKDSLKTAGRPARSKFSPDAEPNPKLMKEMKMQQRMHDDNVGYQADLKRATDVIADLVKDKVIGKAAEVKWFGLSNTEFKVNGQKLSNEMQQRYKTKYGVHEGYGLYYGPVQMTGTGVFIDVTETLARPPHPQRPGPKSVGAAGTRSQDSIVWKQNELIRQQALFAAREDAKREQIVHQQTYMAEQQQRVAEVQNIKRAHILQDQQHRTEQQQNFVAEQNEKRAEIMEKQRQLFARQDEQGKEPWTPKMTVDLLPVMENVVADLVTSNVINDKSDLVKFNLTNAALMVNGKKQPEDIHQKLKAKYLDGPGYINNYRIAGDPNFGLHFNTQNGHMGLGVTDGPDSP